MGRSAGFEVGLGPRTDGLENDLIAGIGPHHDEPYIRPQTVDGAHHLQREGLSMEADQGQGKLLIRQKLRQLKNNKLDARVVVEERDKSLHPDGLWFKQRHPKAARGLASIRNHSLGSTMPCWF